MFRQAKLAVILSALVVSVSALHAERAMEDSLISEMTHKAGMDDMKPNGASGPTLASSLPPLDDYGIHLEIGLLLEQFRVSNTDIAFQHYSTTISGATVLTAPYTNPFRSDDMLRTGFDLDAGLRAVIGYDSRHDDWRFALVFEWLEGTGGVVGPPITGAQGSYQPTNNVDIYRNSVPLGFEQFKATLNIKYYLFEAIISRGSYVSKQFSFEPFTGIKATWIDYTDTQSFFDATNTAGLTDSETWRKKVFTDVWGVGPMVGMNSKFYVANGVSIFSEGNLAVLFGQTKVKYYNGVVPLNSNETPAHNRTLDTDNIATFTMRGIIGLQYDREMAVKGNHFRGRAGFDTRYYLAQYPIIGQDGDSAASTDSAQVYSTPTVQESGDFGMVGLILDFAIDF